jgi:hypothetical protein
MPLRGPTGLRLVVADNPPFVLDVDAARPTPGARLRADPRRRVCGRGDPGHGPRPWGTRTRIAGMSGTADPLNQAKSAWLSGAEWARLDSNQGPTDYESAALTN